MKNIIKKGLIKFLFNKIKYLTFPSEKNNFKSKFLESKILLYCVILLLILKVSTVLIPFNFPQNIFFADITKISLENFANQARESVGLAPLIENQKLNQAAYLKAQNMKLNNYFAHTSPDGTTPWYWFEQAGYNYKFAGENLAIGFFESEEVFQAWLGSPSHRENILNPKYEEMGTAVINGFGPNNAIIVVQEFGSTYSVKQIAPTKNNIETIVPEETTKSVELVVELTETEQAIENITEDEKVLSGSTNIIKSQMNESSQKYYYKFMNSLVYEYDELIQNIIYGISFIVIGILITIILFRGSFKFKKELVFRSSLIVILLSLATLISREVIITIIPHKLII